MKNFAPETINRRNTVGKTREMPLQSRRLLREMKQREDPQSDILEEACQIPRGKRSDGSGISYLLVHVEVSELRE